MFLAGSILQILFVEYFRQSLAVDFAQKRLNLLVFCQVYESWGYQKSYSLFLGNKRSGKRASCDSSDFETIVKFLPFLFHYFLAGEVGKNGLSQKSETFSH